MTQKPIFMISLDTELAWGCIQSPGDKVLALLQNDVSKGRETVSSLLSIFKRHRISATWALVGHLFLDHCQEEKGIAHKDMPRFHEDWYSFDPCSNISQAPLYYGKDVIEMILSSPVKHEIGYHSFSHVPFSECSSEVAEAEIKEGTRLTRQFGFTLESFVFPYNKIGHIDILKKYGFKIYRGQNLTKWGPEQKFLLQKINGAVDKLIARASEPVWRDGIWEIPSAGMFGESQIPFSLLLRSRWGLERAIHKHRIFHIWLHPHGLLVQPALIDLLDRFLGLVSERRDKDEISVMTMGELASYLNRNP